MPHFYWSAWSRTIPTSRTTSRQITHVLCLQHHCPVSNMKLQVTRKRAVHATRPSNSTKQTCLSQSPSSTSSLSNAAAISGPPTIEWKRHAIAAIQKYISIPIIDETATPDANNTLMCPEIHPTVSSELFQSQSQGQRPIIQPSEQQSWFSCAVHVLVAGGLG